MRLTCPNCGAQYEVPDEVIPEEGRDVQCSACGITWFQNHPTHAGEEADGPAAAPEAAQPRAESDDDMAEDAQDSAEAPPPPPRRELDPSVADLLKEEAEQEARARASEAASPIESQPELGLDDGDGEDAASRRAREARARMARMRGEVAPEADALVDRDADAPAEPADTPDIPAPAQEEEVAAATGSAAAGARRDLLPDIDAINPTLRATDEGTAIHAAPAADDGHEPEETGRGGGFSRGFAIALLLAVMLVVTYALAPQLSRDIPVLAPLLEGYVAVVDAGRGWLNGQVTGILVWLDGLTEAKPADLDTA
ncbi:zinc-ribbon domain-containing protein [Rhodosalinus sp. FB01]|uniref:zinc-ribbon domain-containing protein n=1 Tax=Rhodosalinus sp. FB01 TaxID=3239194 RepID=UPI0035262217